MRKLIGLLMLVCAGWVGLGRLVQRQSLCLEVN